MGHSKATSDVILDQHICDNHCAIIETLKYISFVPARLKPYTTKRINTIRGSCCGVDRLMAWGGF